MLKVEKQTTQGPGRGRLPPRQQADPTKAVGLQALEESTALEKNRSQEALETAQNQVRELESHLACQKEVCPGPARGGWLTGLQEAETGGVMGELACAGLS